MEYNSDIIHAVILAGGKSSRMGTEKGLVEFKGKAMIEYIIEAFKKVNLNTSIISSNQLYSKYQLNLMEDLIPNCGPIGGIYTALMCLKGPVFICSCDTPYIHDELIRDLMKENNNNTDITFPMHDGKTEPLCAIYNPTSLSILTRQISNHNYKMQDAIKIMKQNCVDVSKNKYYNQQLFKNLNSMNDILD